MFKEKTNAQFYFIPRVGLLFTFIVQISKLKMLLNNNSTSVFERIHSHAPKMSHVHKQPRGMYKIGKNAQVSIFSSPEPKAPGGGGGGGLIGWDSSWRLPVRPSTLSNMNISETSWSVELKFHLEHHLGKGNAAKCFCLDRIRTLVSMETDSP